MVVANGENPGKIHIAMAGIKSIETEGEILVFHFKSKTSWQENETRKIEITRALINDVEMDCSVHQEINFNGAGNPYVSPDGKYLFFNSGRNGNYDIWWVDAKIIEELRLEEFGK